jgi:hypothetical protein
VDLHHEMGHDHKSLRDQRQRSAGLSGRGVGAGRREGLLTIGIVRRSSKDACAPSPRRVELDFRFRPTADIRCPKFVVAAPPHRDVAHAAATVGVSLRQDSLAFKPKAATCTGPDALDRIAPANACRCEITRAKLQDCAALRQVRGL